MKKVTGIGGIFFKCKDTEAQNSWYAQHLGMNTKKWGTNFEWRDEENPEKKGSTVWTPFPETTKNFEPSTKDFMFNFRVDDLEALVAQLKTEGIELVGELQDSDFGKFAHIMDPEGNKIELWEPKDDE